MKDTLFYDIMGYNYPDDKEYFSISKEISSGVCCEVKKEKKLSNDTSKYEKIINKYKFLYKNIPFVKNIYVCNSLTFKSVHENSDIDFFIVTEKNRIFLAKLFIWIFFKIVGMYGAHEKNKFCVGFYVSENYQDLYPLSIYPFDIYLAYWIAHLQPLYSQDSSFKIFKENMWVKAIIPNYDMKPKKILNIDLVMGKGFLKKILEKLFGFDFFNKILGLVWKKRMLQSKKKLGSKGKNIIILDNILKFQAPDIRKVVYLKYKVLKKHSSTIKQVKQKNLFDN